MAFIPITDLAISEDVVGVSISHGIFGYHLGILLDGGRGQPYILHLAFHKKLKYHRVDEKPHLCWVTCAVELRKGVAKHLTVLFRLIAKRSPEISFGTNFIGSKGCFSENGAYKTLRASSGLTCASFVLEVFRAFGVNFIDETTWEPTEDHDAWLDRVCEELGKVGADKAHIERVRTKANGLRLLPEQLAAAADSELTQRPLNFSAANLRAVAVKTALVKQCGVNQNAQRSS